MIVRVRTKQIAPEPWRNGCGLTRKLFARENEETPRFRISLAHIDQPSPFSAFPGITRTLLMLGGGHLIVTPSRRHAWILTAKSPSIVFSGDEPIIAEPFNGPATCLNVMCSDGAATVRREAHSIIAVLPGGQCVTLVADPDGTETDYIATFSSIGEGSAHTV